MGVARVTSWFQHTAARRRLHFLLGKLTLNQLFQHTAARRRLQFLIIFQITGNSFNTQPRGGGCKEILLFSSKIICFNTQPRGGGCVKIPLGLDTLISFNTQPRGGGCYPCFLKAIPVCRFQHTAARRRLPIGLMLLQPTASVSTHSRAEAAATARLQAERNGNCFNTQPRGGGCSLHKKARKISRLNTVFR